MLVLLFAIQLFFEYFKTKKTSSQKDEMQNLARKDSKTNIGISSIFYYPTYNDFQRDDRLLYVYRQGQTKIPAEKWRRLKSKEKWKCEGKFERGFNKP